MKHIDVNKISTWAGELRNVFTMSDLKVLFGNQTEAALYKKLNGFVREGMLIKVMRGIYATPDAALDEISNRINPDAYISTGTVLSRNMVIGSIPAYRVQAMKTGRSRVYKCKLGVVEHLSIPPDMYFGFEMSRGLKYATPEKAFIDCCYLFHKGKSFSFDLDNDVNKDLLRQDVITEYLKKYDRIFVDFFMEMWE